MFVAQKFGSMVGLAAAVFCMRSLGAIVLASAGMLGDVSLAVAGAGVA
jgi:hypothetical protein